MAELLSRLVAFNGLLPGLPSTNEPGFGLPIVWAGGSGDLGVLRGCEEIDSKSQIQDSRWMQVASAQSFTSIES
jgi:hypothetical protein